MSTTTMAPPKVVSREEWLSARKELLVKEKEHIRQRDALNAERLNLPWVKVEKTYVFDAPDGKKTLRDLFAGRSQLIIQHFMFGPGWKEGCVGCSFSADHLPGALIHLEHHDVTLVVVARATLPELEAFKKRMGWTFPFISSNGSDFNYDYHVSFTPEEMEQGKAYYNYGWQKPDREELSGYSSFYKDAAGDIFHTYSTYARGLEYVLGTYVFLDIAPLGRNEDHGLTDWVRHHDRYDTVKSYCGCH